MKNKELNDMILTEIRRNDPKQYEKGFPVYLLEYEDEKLIFFSQPKMFDYIEENNIEEYKDSMLRVQDAKHISYEI